MDLTVRETTDLKVGDVMEIALRIETLIPDEDLQSKDILNDDDYKHNFDISYFQDGKCIGGGEFTLDEGYYPAFGDSIEDCVEEEMKEVFPEITDYEIFDIDNSDAEYKTAKVRVKAIKE